MNSFFEFFYELMMQVLMNILTFFKKIGEAFVGLFVSFPEYTATIKFYFEQFDLTGKILGVIAIIILAAILGLLVFFILKMLRKYLRFRRKIVDEEELLREISCLNQEVAALIDEKNKIMAMKVSQLGLKPDEENEIALDENGIPITDGEEKPDVADGEELDPNGGVSRFVKLIAVDEKYTENPVKITDKQDYTLAELVDGYRHFAASKMGLYYERDLVMSFVAGLASTRLIILEGISGTGKTSLPYSWGKFLKRDSCICPVQPSWRDRTELIGYLNEFTKRFNESQFLEGIYEFTYREDVGFCVLDEMNLARVEYYFAEILSILEIPNPAEWQIGIVPDTWATDPAHLENGAMTLPTNLWFVGTANNDDSTFSITDKVYDRAIPIQIDTKAQAFECPEGKPMQVNSDYLLKLFAEAKKKNPVSEDILIKLEELDFFVIENFRLAFGNRIMKQMKDFIPVYVEAGGTEIAAFDYMFTYKVLKKIQGLNLAFLGDSMKKLVQQLDKMFGKDMMPHAKAFLERLMKENA